MFNPMTEHDDSLTLACRGTTLPFIWPPPDHLQCAPEFEEPILPFPPPASLVAREMEKDANR